MKKILILMVAILLVATGISYAGIANTAHDLTYTSNTYYTTDAAAEICAFCHTPHAASTSADPLWNRSAANLTYTMYDVNHSSTIDMTVATAPEGVSAACLSCHDGATAFDSLINFPGSGLSGSIGNWANGDTVIAAGVTALGVLNGSALDLTTEHPISITYSVSDDADFNAITNNAVNTLPLYSGKVECGSCHDPHDNTTAVPFLRLSNAGSALCLKCHIK